MVAMVVVLLLVGLQAIWVLNDKRYLKHTFNVLNIQLSTHPPPFYPLNR